MKKISDEQKAMLKELQWHRGYKLLLELVESFEYDVLNRLKNIDVTNENDLSILSKNQNYLKWIQDFIWTIKSSSNKIGKKDFE